MKETISENQEIKIKESKPEMQSESLEVLDTNLDPELIEEIQKNAESSLEDLDKEDIDKKKGWGEPVEGEVEIDGEKVKVRYREKLITLPKHRQEQTGIKQIRRRELLPPLPEINYEAEYFSPDSQPISEKIFTSEKDKKEHDRTVGGSAVRKFDATYNFLTNGRFPSRGVFIHMFNYLPNNDPEENANRFKKEGLYFQEVFPEKSKFVTYYDRARSTISISHKKNPRETGRQDNLSTYDLFCSQGRPMRSHYIDPIFIFGNKNSAFTDYIDSVFNNNETLQMLKNEDGSQESYQYNCLKYLREDKPVTNGNKDLFLRCIRHPNIKPLRWCHAECALIPTKRGLNVLFFETGDSASHETSQDKQQ